jgi:tetratricopeptide (TPR) repeat protein
MNKHENERKYRYYCKRIGQAMEAANKGQYESVNDIYTQLLADREVSELYNQRGLAFENLGNLPKAIEDLTRAIELSPESETYELYLKRAASMCPDEPTGLHGRTTTPPPVE